MFGGPSRSRGMGLAIVYTAVRNAGGFLKVESKEGAGSRFEAYFPLARNTVAL